MRLPVILCIIYIFYIGINLLTWCEIKRFFRTCFVAADRHTDTHIHTVCVKHSIHFCIMNLLSFRNSYNDFFLSLKGVSCYSKAKNTWNALACIGITHRLRSCQKYQTNKVKRANRHEPWGRLLFYKADLVVLYFISPANGLKKTFASVCFTSSEAIRQQICFPYLWLHSG